MLNPYVWNLYLSDGGNKTVELFRKTFREELTLQYIEAIITFQNEYCAMDNGPKETEEQLRLLLELLQENVDIEENLEVNMSCEEQQISDIETDQTDIFTYQEENDIDAARLLELFLRESDSEDFEKIFLELSDMMALHTTTLAIAYPNMFVPYYFKYNDGLRCQK